MNGKKLTLLLAVAAAGIGLDRFVKLWAADWLSGKGVVDVIPGVLHLVYVENTGAALGFLRDARWLLVSISALASAAIVFVLARGLIRGSFGQWALACVLSGALGNLIDRALFGYVVDLFEFSFVSFAVFNVADVFVTLGGVATCIYFLFLHDKKAAA